MLLITIYSNTQEGGLELWDWVGKVGRRAGAVGVGREGWKVGRRRTWKGRKVRVGK